MISVLIPVYNYDITKLVFDLHSQLETTSVVYEIICLDDSSTPSFTSSNIELKNNSNIFYYTSKVNQGIAVTRQKLVESAKFNWILLLDADTQIPKDYIKNYLKIIDKPFDYIFGGFTYDKISPDSNKILRWKYGQKCEAIAAKKRNKNPYKVTIAANLLTRKDAYISLGLDSLGNNYAMDYYFGSLLKTTKARVLHIDNQVIHLGIESSVTYLSKKEKAVNTLLTLYHEGKLENHSNDLLKFFLLLRKTKLNYLFSIFYKVFNPLLRRNLVSKNPIILFLQLFKISYMCNLDLKKK